MGTGESLLCTSSRFRWRSLPPGDSHGAAQDAGLGSWAAGPPCQANAWAPARDWGGCLELSFQGKLLCSQKGNWLLGKGEEALRKRCFFLIDSLYLLVEAGQEVTLVFTLRFPSGDTLARGLQSWGPWCPEGEGWPPADTQGPQGDTEPACPTSASWPGRSKPSGPLTCQPSTSSQAGPCVLRLLPAGWVLSQRSGQHSGLAEMSIGVFYVFIQFYISVDFCKPVKFNFLNG